MDEYDALLEEPFGEDVDWAAIDSMSQVIISLTPTIPRSSSNLTSGNALSNVSDDVRLLRPIKQPQQTEYAVYSSPKNRISRFKVISPTKNKTSLDPRPCQCELRKPTKKRKYLQAIEDILECTICFNIIAAAYSLPCGHIACGLCLNDWLKSNSDCFVCREPANAVFIPNFSIDRLAELYFKNKLDMNETEREEYRQWQNRLEAGRNKIQARRSKRFKSKKTTAQTPPRDRVREGRRERNSRVTINANPPPSLDPLGGPLPLGPPPHNPVAIIPANPSVVNQPRRNQRQRQSTPIMVTPEIITEEVIHVIPYHHTIV